jgi:hypothetical protein
MARKGWASLSANYRARLEKAGISKRDYEQGQSIRAARGHAQTPERPSQAKNFPTYHAEQTRLINTMVARKNAFFNTSPKWNPVRAAKPFKDNPPSIKLLRVWSKMSREEWLDEIRTEPDTATYLGYH